MRLSHYLRLAILISLLASCTEQAVHLTCSPEIPDQYPSDPQGWQQPNDQSEAARYRTAYEAFWWHCVSVKATNLSAVCPVACSGTPAAAAGCADGALNLEGQLEALLNSHPSTAVIEYLKALAATEEAHEKTNPYFTSGTAVLQTPQGD